MYKDMKSWLDWWMQPEQRMKIFAAYMSPDLLARDLPQTSNAQEAQHAKEQREVGVKHNLLEGRV